MQFSCPEFCRFSVLCSLDYYYIISVLSFKVVFVYFYLMIIFLYWVLRWVAIWCPMWIWVLKQKPAESHWFKTHFVGHVKDQREIPLGSLKWLCCLEKERCSEKESRRQFVYRPIIFSLPHAENAPKCGGARSQSSIPWTEGIEQQPVWSTGGVVGYRSNKELAGSS